MTKKYKDIVLNLLWKKGHEGLIVSQINDYIATKLGRDHISKTAISLFLDQLCKDAILTYKKETCRGGIRRRYFLKKTKEECEKDMIRNMLLNMVGTQPKQAAEVLIEILNDETYYLNFSWNVFTFLLSRNEITYPGFQSPGDLGNPLSL